MSRILVVDDDPNDAELTLRALECIRLRDAVDIARDGQEALDYLECRGSFAGRSTGDPAVILMDVKMPRVDGMTLYRAMAAATPALARRVIFVTGDVAGTDAERFLDESGCRWLAKPFRLADLLRAVRDTLT